MIPPNFFFQIYISLFEPDDCTPPKCEEQSEYTGSAHLGVENLSSSCMNESNVCDRCRHDIRQLHLSYTSFSNMLMILDEESLYITES